MSSVERSRPSLKGTVRRFAPFADFLDTTRLEVINRARGGRSSRTFYAEGLWNSSLEEFRKGDFVIIQFGHNDGGPIDKPKFRGSIPGTENESMDVELEDGSIETVYSYGWYLRKYISDAREKGAYVIVLSHIPRNRWVDGMVERNNNDYGLWTKEVADSEDVFFIDFNGLVAQKYEEMGAEAVASLFPNDHTHTNEEGALLNAGILAGALSQRNSPLRNYMNR